MSKLSRQAQNHLGNALIFMTRYALPRNTSADMATTSALKVLWDEVLDADRQRIIDTIESEKDLYGNDPMLWNEFLKGVKQ